MAMKVLLVAATFKEVEIFAHAHQLKAKPFQRHTHFDLLITGVGMVNTAFALGQQLHNNYRLIINIGIAGAFNRDFNLASLVEVTEDCIADFGAVDADGHFISITELGFGNDVFKCNHTYPLNLTKVKGLTVNKVSGMEADIQQLEKYYAAQIESMEGAAVFFAAQQCAIPVMQVRAISNYVEARSKAGWQIKPAIENLNQWLLSFMAQYYDNDEA